MSKFDNSNPNDSFQEKLTSKISISKNSLSINSHRIIRVQISNQQKRHLKDRFSYVNLFLNRFNMRFQYESSQIKFTLHLEIDILGINLL